MSDTMKIPFVDLKTQYRSIAPEIDEAIAKVVTDCAFIKGKYVKEFEENFAAFCQAKHCIGVGNGTDALFIVLKALDIGPGNEVIVPANTFVATSEAVTMAGAKVVFVDCDPQTYNIDVNQIESKITSKTKAIIPVHLYGQPADMKAIKAIADKHGLKIVQDCAQAHGSEINEKPLIEFGDVICFSFYPGKNLGAYGDGGAVVVDDGEVATKIRMLANHGRLQKYNHEFEGVNSRLDGIQAAILNVKLKYLDQWIEKRRKNSKLYNQLLLDLGIITPKVMQYGKHVYHLYVIRVSKRDNLRKYLQENGIATGVHYPTPLPFLEAYRYLCYKVDDFPVAEKVSKEILSLPMYPELSNSSIVFIAEQIREFFTR